jgi:hypothetical protein
MLMQRGLRAENRAIRHEGATIERYGYFASSRTYNAQTARHIRVQNRHFLLHESGISTCSNRIFFCDFILLKLLSQPYYPRARLHYHVAQYRSLMHSDCPVRHDTGINGATLIENKTNSCLSYRSL